MYVDFKYTGWERAVIPKDKEKEVLEKIRSGEISNSDDLFNQIPEVQINDIEETQSGMSIDDNGGNPTIEVIEDGETILDNGVV